MISLTDFILDITFCDIKKNLCDFAENRSFDVTNLIFLYHKIDFLVSKILADLQNRFCDIKICRIFNWWNNDFHEKKNAGVFPIPADTKFRACALIKLFKGAMIWYHKINFWYHKIDFLTWQIRFLDFTKSILWYKKSQKFCDIKIYFVISQNQFCDNKNS